MLDVIRLIMNPDSFFFFFFSQLREGANIAQTYSFFTCKTKAMSMPQQSHVFPQHPGNMQPPHGMMAPQQGMPPANMQYRKRPSEADTLAKHIK
jgi:hypothetical protein